MPVVSYGRTYNMGNFESERIGLEDDVQQGESFEDAYERVRLWVERKHAATLAMQDTKERIDTLRTQHGAIRDKVVTLRARYLEIYRRYQQLEQIITTHGGEVPPLMTWLLPDRLITSTIEELSQPDSDDDDMGNDDLGDDDQDDDDR